MSGLEIAGVVLGSLPLIISGLEHYAQGVSTIKRIFKASAEFRSLSRRLRVEHDIFRNAIELLLTDCVEDQKLQDLLNAVGGETWSEPAVDAALQRKLQRSYKVYLETVQDIDRTLTTFRERLHLTEDGKGPFNVDDKASFRESYKRFKFGIRKADYADLIEEISKDTTALLKLTEQSTALEPTRTTRKRLPAFETIRGHASSMFSTLQRGLHGSCTATHKASLYMRPLESSDDHTFRIVLQHQELLPHLPSQWSLEEAEVRLLDMVAEAKGAVDASCNAPLQITKGMKALRFDLPSSDVQALPQPAMDPPVSIVEIKDLCLCIQQLRASKCGVCLGYLQDHTGARRHGLYWPEAPLVDRTTLTSCSLGSVLRGNSQDPAACLSVADSRRLALSLALGVLRLHDTPWLAKQWSRDDITLFQQSGVILARHPFVSADLHAYSRTSSTAPCPAIGNETLFALGIVLIELCMEQSFDELMVPTELNADGSKHALSEFLAAQRLVDVVYDRAGKRYGDAVRRCIRCEFDQRKTSLEDDAFRRAVYDNVIAVLEEDVRQFFDL